jgi:signal transduction protein with GAF and PtsI domain
MRPVSIGPVKAMLRSVNLGEVKAYLDIALATPAANFPEAFRVWAIEAGADVTP